MKGSYVALFARGRRLVETAAIGRTAVVPPTLRTGQRRTHSDEWRTLRPAWRFLLVLSVEVDLMPRVVELVLDAPAEATRA
jgi:hypothetical protein